MMILIFQWNKLNYVWLCLALIFVGNVQTESNETSKLKADEKPPAIVQQKSVKKELKVNITSEEAIVEITPRTEGEHDDHSDKLVIIGETSGKTQKQHAEQKGSKEISILETVTKVNTLSLQHLQHDHHVDKEFALNDKHDDDISDALKVGLYISYFLSSGAAIFIVYKIYRLRVSRPKSKYGIQGNCTNQELTPLPTSIEDGHSDDDDQTLFDIQART